MPSFFLIQVEPGHADAVAAFVARIPGVGDVCVTSGPYDVVAQAAAETEHLERIRAAIRKAPALSRLCVCRGTASQRQVAS